MNVLGAQKLSHVEMSHLNKTRNESMSDGLAWNYYYNYLKIVLPHLQGTVWKAVLPDYVAEDADMCNVIDLWKLFIIISEMCSCYSGLIEADHIQKAGLLRIFYMTRAGVELKAY